MKNQQKYKVIGLMSGTSLDGLDMAYCEFTYTDKQWSFRLLAAQTADYPHALLNTLRQSTLISGFDLTRLDVDLGRFIGESVNAFIKNKSLEVDLIASHGHTVFHQSENGITKQIGEGNVIAAVTGLPVVYDFRSLDVALGGQGAPLVPIGDKLLFHSYDYCLNLGGIANISFEKKNQRLAYDICPCNMVLNHLANHLEQEYDENGDIARKGTVVEPLLQALDCLDFYKNAYPKSLGFEWVRDNILPLLESHAGRPEDLMRTFVEHIANQIRTAVHTSTGTKKLLVTGGGTHNTFLIERIKDQLSTVVEVVLPENDIINYKEAIVFGFLGVLRIRSAINCLSSVTGARYDNSGGAIVGNLKKILEKEIKTL